MSALWILGGLVVGVVTAVVITELEDRRYMAWFKNLSASEKDAYCAWLRSQPQPIRKSLSGLRALYERELAVSSRALTEEGEGK